MTTDTAYDPLQVSITSFEGPLDLLLHLVRKQQVDIREVRLAEVTEPYLAYVERMQALNLDQGGEFLALAATLVWLKSRTLLPPEPGEGDEDEPDPETVEELLLQRLQAYQRFKEAAVSLTERDMLGRDVFPRQAPPEEDEAPQPEAPFADVSLFGLLEAFRGVLERSRAMAELHLLPERARIEEKIDEVLERLVERQALYFADFFATDADREEVVLTFIAVLELARLGAVHLAQAQALGPVWCRAGEDLLARPQTYREHVLDSMYGTRGDGAESRGA